jgi:hypothetical protein
MAPEPPPKGYPRQGAMFRGAHRDPSPTQSIIRDQTYHPRRFPQAFGLP